MTQTEGASIAGDLSFTPEHEELRRTVRSLLTKRESVSWARAAAGGDTSYDDEVWQVFCEQLALPGLAIPESFGGQGFGWVEQAIVLEEMGRQLHGSPYVATTVLAATALLASGDADACAEHLPRIAAGKRFATCVLRWRTDEPSVIASTGDGGEAQLNGDVDLVVDGDLAELILVPAENADGDRELYAVRGDAPGVQRTRRHVLDATRSLAGLSFRAAPATPVGATGDCDRIMEWVWIAAVASLAAELVGVADRSLEIAVEHAKHRRQFGRSIGAFQAVKHKCADMLVEVESARSMAMYLPHLLAAADLGQPVDSDVTEAAAATAYVCGRAAPQVTKDMIQVLGGIGYTWEHDAHLYLRRAKATHLLLASPDRVSSRLAMVSGGAR